MVSGSVGRKPCKLIQSYAVRILEVASKISQRKDRTPTTRCMLYPGVQLPSTNQTLILFTRQERSLENSEQLLRAIMEKNWERRPRKRNETMLMLKKHKCLQMYSQIDFEEYIRFTMQDLTMLRKREHISDKTTKTSEVLLTNFQNLFQFSSFSI